MVIALLGGSRPPAVAQVPSARRATLTRLALGGGAFDSRGRLAQDASHRGRVPRRIMALPDAWNLAPFSAPRVTPTARLRLFLALASM